MTVCQKMPPLNGQRWRRRAVRPACMGGHPLRAGICRIELRIGYVAEGAGSSRMLDFGNRPASGLVNELCQRLSTSAQ